MATAKKRRYVDMTERSDCVGFISKEYELIPAGTTIYSMPISVRKREYDAYAQFSEKSGIFFIFDDNVPDVSFYAVPRVDIAAYDNNGGLFGMIGGTFDTESCNMVCYIDSERNVYTICRGDEFIEAAPHWRELMKPCDTVRIYSTKASATFECEFIEL